MSYIITHGATRFSYEDVNPESVDAMDICISLSRIPRYLGHTNRFYSVAEHTVYGAMYIPVEYRLAWCLHDATEAYLGDMPRTLKGMCPGFVEMEAKVDSAVREAFGLGEWDKLEKAAVKVVDNRMLATEMRDLMPRDDYCERHGYAPYDIKIPVWCDQGKVAAILYQEIFSMAGVCDGA